MGRGTRDDPLTDDELTSWWIRVRQQHAAANAAWQAEIERKLKDNASDHGAYDRASEGKTGQNKEKKSVKEKDIYKPVKISKSKTSKGRKSKRKKTDGPRLL